MLQDAATIQAETVVEYAIRALRDAIREGRLAQGQRLVVADVTKMLGVSNGPVREAIRRLTGEGLVEITPNRGAAVREYNSRDVAEIFQVREVLEGLASRLAAENIGKGDNRKRLRTSMAEMRTVLRTGQLYVSHNQSFHELIYDMAENTLIREQSRQLVLPIYRFHYHSFMDPGYAEISAAEHQSIAEAIFDADGPRAEHMMQNHIHNSGCAMLQALDTYRDSLNTSPRLRPRGQPSQSEPQKLTSARDLSRVSAKVSGEETPRRDARLKVARTAKPTAKK